jgi:integrase
MKVTYIERSPGAWRLRIEHGQDAQGKRLFRYETIRGTEDDAARRRFTILNENDAGTFALPDKTTVAGYFAKPADAPYGFWVSSRLAVGAIGKSTADNYQVMLDAYFVRVLGAMRLQDVRGTDIQRTYTAMLTNATRFNRKPSLATALHLHRVLTVAFGSIRQQRLITINPMEEVERPRAPKTKRKALNEATVGDVLLPAIVDHWTAPLVFVGLGAGLRRGEVLGQRWRDIDLEAGKATVAGQIVQYRDNTIAWTAPKTAAGVRTIDLPAELVDLYRRLKIEALERRVKLGLGRDIRDCYVFTRDGINPIRPKFLTLAFGKLCDAHGLDDFTFHGLRHTHSTALLRHVGREGAKAVSQRLGHASVTVTLEMYQTVFDEDARRLGDMASGLLGGKR